MRCDFQKSECHFQSRSCSLYSFKATDKILKRGEGGGVNGYKCPHTIRGIHASVCSYLRGKKDRQIRYLAPRFTSLRIWNLGVLSYYFLPNTLKHTGIFGHGLHPRLPFFMINRITFFPSSSEKHWYVCSLCRALSSKINISLVVPA